MTEILWNITLGSWLTAAAIILIRLIFCRVLSPRAKYLLWMLLALRLCMPVLPESQLSLMNLEPFSETPAIETETRQPVPVNTIEVPVSVQESTATVQTESVTQPEITLETPVETDHSGYFSFLTLWFVGMLVCFGGYFLLWLRTWKKLRQAKYVDDPETVRCFLSVRKCLGVKREIRFCYGHECLIGGLMKPTLLIPRELTGEPLKAALTHELMHYKSGDLWIAAFQRMLCCIYWFNPVVWLSFRWARLDCEKACDQRVLELRQISPAIYAELLFEESKMKQQFQFGTTSFGRQNIKSRIKFVASFKKPAVWMMLIAVITAIVVLVCTLTAKASEKPWNWAENLDITDITEAYILDGDVKLPLEDSQIEDIVEKIHEIEQDSFSEVAEIWEPESTLVLICGQETYQIGLVLHPERQLAMELDGTMWLFDSSALAWEIRREVFENDLSPASYPLSILLDIPEDSEILESFKILQQDATYDDLFSVLDEKMGDYITDQFMDYFAGSAGIGKLWANAALYDYTVFCEELKVTKNDLDTTNYNYSARLIITRSDGSKQTIPVSGIVRCDEAYQVTSISCDSAALTEFYQFLSDEPIYTEFLAFEPMEPEKAEVVDVYIPNTGWSTFLEFEKDIVTDDIIFSCDVPDIVTFTPERARLKATGVGDCNVTLEYHGLVMRLSVHVFNWTRSSETVAVIPPSEIKDPEVTVLPHTDGDEPEVSTLPQEEWKPKIQEIKDTLYLDFNRTGDIYQSDATLVELLEAASDTSIVSLTLSTGDVVWRVPSADCAEIADQISVGSSIVVDLESEYGYFYLRNDNIYALIKNALYGLVMCEFIDNLTYAPDDPVYFWRAVHYGSGGEYGNLNDEKNWVEYSESEILEISKVLFSGNETIPEIPAAWNDIYQKTSDGDYRIKTGEYGFVGTNMGPISSQGNGIFAADITLMENQDTVGYWVFELRISNGMLSVVDMSANKVKK